MSARKNESGMEFTIPKMTGTILNSIKVGKRGLNGPWEYVASIFNSVWTF